MNRRKNIIYRCRACEIPFKKILYYCEKYNIDVYGLNLNNTCKLIKLYEIDHKIRDGLFVHTIPPNLEDRLKKVVSI
jgi:nucleoid-associated protein YejK